MIKWTKAILATTVSFLVCFYWGRFSGFTGFTFAWILNFVLMAWYTYLDSLFNWKYDSSYFNSRSWEKGGSLYKLFGVQFYRKLLVWTGWEKLNKKNNEITGKKSSLELAEFKSRSSETGHSIIFLIVGIISLLVLIVHPVKGGLWLIILNVLLNVYPVFVQRYNRPRYRKILQEMKS